MSTIDEVKARLDIVETVTAYVPTLKKSGRTYKALCPFHNERTPSFTVDPGRGSWHCFGACSTGGDVIEFVRRIEGLEFKEALRVCAERAGVELRPPSAREREQREQHERLLRANEAAAVFFQAALQGPQGTDALGYAEQRGLDAETRERWQIGFAPGGWRGLADHLTARGFTDADLLEAGLAAEGERGVYDRFRERLIFPTRDVRGRLIGFGARALRPEDEPKYLNTPQTPLFEKSATLYGLDRAAEEARRAGRIVVVEGYMDVIAAHQFGIVNVVASMGTAITDRQMALVKRFTENVVLALDADTAGSEATLRGVQVAADASERTATPAVDWRGLVTYQDVLKADIRVASLPQGEDPDTLVRADPDRFRALIDEAKPVVDHLLDAVTAQIEPDDPRSRSRALETLAPTVAAIADPVVRAHYVQRLARIGQVDERTVVSLLGRRTGGRQRPSPVPTQREAAQQARHTAEPPDGETQLLQLLLHRPECRAVSDRIDPDSFEQSTNRRLFEAWRESADLEARDGDLDEEVAERYHDLRDGAPEWLDVRYLDGRNVEEMAMWMASQLRIRRRGARLAPAALEQATQVAGARRDGGDVLDSAMREVHHGPLPESAAGETAELASEFVAIAERQRDLARAYRSDTRRRSVRAGGDVVQEEEGADDADL